MRTSTAIWLTTAVWFGNRISLVSWCVGLPLPFPLAALVPGAGVAVSGSTMKAPLKLILTLPGLNMVLSISSVEVMVLGLLRRPSSSWSSFGSDSVAADEPRSSVAGVMATWWSISRI